MKFDNEKKYYVQQGLYSMAALMVSGAVLQTFLLECGISASLVSFYTSFMQVVQMAVMILCSRRLENLKNIILTTAIMQIVQTIILFVLLLFCFLNHIPISAKCFLIFFVGIFINIAQGIYNVICYKLPYHIMDMRRYGVVMGISGTIVGIIGILFSAILTVFLNQFSYFYVMAAFLLLGIAGLTAAAGITLCYRDNGFIKTDMDQKEKMNLFTYKPFLTLFLPNLMRGFTGGIFNLMVTVGYHYQILDSTSAGYLLIITNAAMIVGCIAYSYMAKKHIDRWIILLCSIGIFIVTPMILAGKNTMMFLAMYGVGYFILNLINYSVPVAVTLIVDYKVMSQYTAWRMMLNTLGGALAGMICIPMLELLGGIPAFIITGAMQLISGTAYFVCMKKTKCCSRRQAAEKSRMEETI